MRLTDGQVKIGTVLRPEKSHRQITDALGRGNGAFQYLPCFLFHGDTVFRCADPQQGDRLVIQFTNTDTGQRLHF